MSTVSRCERKRARPRTANVKRYVKEATHLRGNLSLERRLGRNAALVIASILFGLSHFNKRSAHFNWRYVLLATVAGIFYGRAWRSERRVAASAITHTCVDWLWSWWF